MDNEFEFEFEFGCITPKSPDQNDTVSPADQFFPNGRLPPHSFPVQSRSPASETHSRVTTSRGSSIGSSLMSSRCNSTSSSRSGTTSCSSARTSASDATERKTFQKNLARERLYGNVGSPATVETQRWRFISLAPVLAPGVSRRTSTGEFRLRRKVQSPKKKKEDVGGEGNGFCERILRSFVMSCRACHAMEGAVLERDDIGRHLELK